MQTETVRCDSWTRESIEQFTEYVGDRKFVTFHVDATQSERCFGKLLLHSEDGSNNTFSVANGLCERNVAIQDRNYIYGNKAHIHNFNSNLKLKVKSAQ